MISVSSSYGMLAEFFSSKEMLSHPDSGLGIAEKVEALVTCYSQTFTTRFSNRVADQAKLPFGTTANNCSEIGNSQILAPRFDTLSN